MKIKDYNLSISSIITDDPKESLAKIRDRYANAIIQMIDIDAIVDKEHIEEMVKLALEAYERNVMIADHIEMELLLRIACTNQIYKAIEFAGAKPNKLAILLILSRDHIESEEYEIEYNKDRIDKLVKYHNIKEEELDAVLDHKLTSLLIEKANLIY
jgi:tRNA threonylcarbamoyladenosine modification (KEOPS) complex Cgi121 subunit